MPKPAPASFASKIAAAVAPPETAYSETEVLEFAVGVCRDEIRSGIDKIREALRHLPEGHPARATMNNLVVVADANTTQLVGQLAAAQAV
jgi:hypothetical protein